MKAAKKNNALEGIKKEQLKRRVFAVEFKAEVVRHQKAENISTADCARKFDVLPKGSADLFPRGTRILALGGLRRCKSAP